MMKDTLNDLWTVHFTNERSRDRKSSLQKEEDAAEERRTEKMKDGEKPQKEYLLKQLSVALCRAFKTICVSLFSIIGVERVDFSFVRTSKAI